MALRDIIDPTNPKPGKMPKTSGDPIIKGIDILTDEYLYKGLSEDEMKRFKNINENLKAKGEVYDPQRRKIFKLGKPDKAGNYLIPMDSVFQAYENNYNPFPTYANQADLPGLLKANNLYQDPRSGDVFPIR